MTLEITEVRISLRDDDKLKAFASMTFNDSFVIRGLKIIEGTNGMFVAMPSRKRPDGTYQDVAHPINNETRKFIEDRILDEYQQVALLTGRVLVGSEERLDPTCAAMKSSPLHGAGLPGPTTFLDPHRVRMR